MTEYKETDIIFHTKDGEFTVAVVIKVDYLPSGCYLTVVTQNGKMEVIKDCNSKARQIHLGYDVQKTTNGICNFLSKKYQKMIDNFDAKKAMENYKNNYVEK